MAYALARRYRQQAYRKAILTHAKSAVARRRTEITRRPLSEMSPDWWARVDAAPRLRPYESLAKVWTTLGDELLHPYGGYSASLLRYRNPFVRLNTALDLACGAGAVAQDLARYFRRVYAVDPSQELLDAGRARDTSGRIEWRLGDFANIGVDQPVQVVTCGGNSLNYVLGHDELAGVFRAVRDRLVPGGLFYFDVVSESLAEETQGGFVDELEHEGEMYYIAHRLDPRTHDMDCFALTPQGYEVHKRFYFAVADIQNAADRAGLGMLGPPQLHQMGRYILTRS
jgi:SAM-dependent methyltransferase